MTGSEIVQNEQLQWNTESILHMMRPTSYH